MDWLLSWIEQMKPAGKMLGELPWQYKVLAACAVGILIVGMVLGA